LRIRNALERRVRLRPPDATDGLPYPPSGA